MIRELGAKDWPAVKAIFEEGIATGQATFETEAPTWEHWDGAHFGGLVAEESVYVAGRARGRGVGRALLAAVIDRSERTGIWTLLAGVFPENRASVTLHVAAGFRTVGVYERIGRLNGEWRDVRLMERRSEVIR